MIKLLKPWKSKESVLDITVNELIQNGIKGIILDMDNTIVPYFTTVVESRHVDWLQDLMDNGIRIFVLTNSVRGRTQTVFRQICVEFRCNAFKPLPFGFLKAISVMKLQKKECLIVGDQIFTDVLGGNLIGVKVALVKPLSVNGEIFTTKFNRKLEQLFLSRNQSNTKE